MKKNRIKKTVQRDSNGRNHDAANASVDKPAWRTARRHEMSRPRPRLINQSTKQRLILRPKELAAYLRAAMQHVPELLAYLVLCGFAGLRTCEARNLRWSMIGLDSVRLNSASTKSGTSRDVPISPTLQRWLAAIPGRKDDELAVPDDFEEHIETLRKHVEKTRLRSPLLRSAHCLRQSCLSYRMAEAGMLQTEPSHSVGEFTGGMIRRRNIKAYRSVQPADFTTGLPHQES